MKRTALIACAALVASAAPAMASETTGAAARTADSASQIHVVLCSRDALTQAAFRNQFGPRPVYVTASQVMSARASGERWSGARCMTSGQHQRLSQMMRARTTR